MKAKAKTPAVTAEHIVGLLAARHGEDVFVAECKNGPSWGEHLLRLDAWALVRTWSPPTTIGYEIKVSRADFEQDQKWPGYLPLCHQFYFCCPAGLIRAVDLTPGVGLIWVGANRERLHVKVKPTRRAPDPGKLVALMTYVLMSRTVIVGDMQAANEGQAPTVPTELQRVQAMAEVARAAEARGELAHFVTDHVHRRVRAAAEKLAEAARLAGQADEFAARLAKLGIAWDPGRADWEHRLQVRREIDVLADAVDDHVLAVLERGGQAILRVVGEVRRLRDEQQAGKAGQGPTP